MVKKVVLVVMMAVLLGVALTACDRPASSSPAPSPTGGGIPFPVVQPTTSLGNLATQTAFAKTNVPLATAKPGTTNPTALPGQPTAPPVVNPTAAPPQPTAVPPTALPEIVVPSATPGRPASYVIQPGDHYVCIARRYNLDLGNFLAVNGLSMYSQAVVGATVKIPQSGSWDTANGSRMLVAHPATYVVRAGDTLNKIACAYGDVDPNSIIIANSLKAPYSLSAGQSLRIP